MATTKPATVVIKAAETPGAIVSNAALLLLADHGEGVHHAPDRAEQAQKRPAADRAGQKDQAGFQFDGLAGHGAFHGAFDVLHAFERQAGPGRAAAGGFEPGVQFLAAFLIDGKKRAAEDLQTALENAEDVFLRAEFGIEVEIELFWPGAFASPLKTIMYQAKIENSARTTRMTRASTVARDNTNCNCVSAKKLTGTFINQHPRQPRAAAFHRRNVEE